MWEGFWFLANKNLKATGMVFNNTDAGLFRDKLRGAGLPALAPPFVIRSAAVQSVATAAALSTLGIAYSVLAGMSFSASSTGAGSGRCWSRPCRCRVQSC